MWKLASVVGLAIISSTATAADFPGKQTDFTLYQPSLVQGTVQAGSYFVRENGEQFSRPTYEAQLTMRSRDEASCYQANGNGLNLAATELSAANLPLQAGSLDRGEHVNGRMTTVGVGVASCFRWRDAANYLSLHFDGVADNTTRVPDLEWQVRAGLYVPSFPAPNVALDFEAIAGRLESGAPERWAYGGFLGLRTEVNRFDWTFGVSAWRREQTFEALSVKVSRRILAVRLYLSLEQGLSNSYDGTRAEIGLRVPLEL